MVHYIVAVFIYLINLRHLLLCSIVAGEIENEKQLAGQEEE